jgi:hypothetical protein
LISKSFLAIDLKNSSSLSKEESFISFSFIPLNNIISDLILLKNSVIEELDRISALSLEVIDC